MNFKLFTDSDKANAEKAVNDWLASLPKNPTIHRSDTSLGSISVPAKNSAGKTTSKKVPYVSISVWYD